MNTISALGTVKTNAVQGQVVGLVDNKAKLEKLMHACRGICGRSEQKLLHRETVYKLPNQPAQATGQRASNYEIRYRLGKIATSEPDKFVQPMSLIYLGDPLPLPRTCEKFFPDVDAVKKLPRPTLRKVIEVRLNSLVVMIEYLDKVLRKFFMFRSKLDLHVTNL
jgi:hypothetical protein